MFGKLFKKLYMPTSSAQESPSVQLLDDLAADERVYRYRKQRGVNLGSWFVLERWIADAPFAQAAPPGQSDLDVAKGPHAKEILEHHWDTWITNADFEWLAAKGINAVRIPIGFYHLCTLDRTILSGTDFHGLGSVFEGAWIRLVRAVETAKLHRIGVLFDLHAAPGKQNQDSHSGTSSPAVSFATRSNLELTVRILRILLLAVRSLRSQHDPPVNNIIGVELLNEPKPPSHPALKDWYTQAIKELRAIDPGIPIYISDCWMSDDYANFVKWSLSGSVAPVCLDHHLYRCFTHEDISTPVARHSASLIDPNAPTPQTFARVAGILEDAGGALVVGEWSGALNPGSLQGPIDEREERARYIAAQLALFEQHCAGWFFWTYRKQFGGDQGWSFRDAVEAGVFPHQVGMYPNKVPVDESDRVGRKAAALDRALGRHTSYWAQYPGHYEHWRFSKGYDQGWEDAYRFLLHDVATEHAVSELGFQGLWKKKRAHEHGVQDGFSNHLWEYEHGYVQGVHGANVDFGGAYC